MAQSLDQPTVHYGSPLSAYQRAAVTVIALLLFLFLKSGSHLIRNIQDFGISYEFAAVVDRANGQPAIYYDTGEGLSEAQVMPLKCVSTGEHFSCRGRLFSPAEIIGLRYDPNTAPGEIRLFEFTISSSAGRTLSLSNGDLNFVSPNEQLTIEQLDGDYLLMSSGNDPFVAVVSSKHARLGAALATTGMSVPFAGVLLHPLLRSVVLAGFAQLILVLCFRRNINLHVASLAALAVCFVANASLATPTTFSPDEGLHLKAFEYYAKGALFPPLIGSAEARPYESSYHAFSYLYMLEPVYQLYGSMAAALYVPSSYFTAFARGLQFLLLCAGLLLLLRSGSVLGIAVILFSMSTPQVLYLFSYFNGDAIGFVTSSAALLFMVTWARKQTDIHEPVDKRLALIFGITYGIACLSKSFYIVPVLATAVLFAYLVIRSLRYGDGEERRALATFFFFATVIVMARLAIDIATYGMGDICTAGVGKCEALRSYQSLYAKMPSYGKPVSLAALWDIVSDSEWLGSSLRSYMIGFGYMQYFAPPAYYPLAAGFWVAASIGLLWQVFRSQNALTAFVVSGVLLIGVVAMPLGLSAFYSTTYDYQPQGRYLFSGSVIALGLLTWFRASMDRLLLRPVALYAVSTFVLLNLAVATDVLLQHV